MSTITKEKAKDLRNAFECWQQDYDPVEDKEQHDMFGLGVVAMDALLASLEAEPVAYIIQDSDARGRGEKGILRYFANISDEDINEYQITVTPLFTAPPSPVSVPAAMEMDDDFDSAFEHGKAVGWNAYRAAMLQSFGNSEQLNSPVIPDGWKLVPIDPTKDMLRAGQSVVGFWLNTVHCYSKMLAAAPAAPQQEAENRIQIGKSEAKEEWDMGARLTKHRFKP